MFNNFDVLSSQYLMHLSFLQYGHFFPDPQYEHVQHIICCDSFATYAYDFNFSHPEGFSRYDFFFSVYISLNHGTFQLSALILSI